jgi:hypothetical protein
MMMKKKGSRGRGFEGAGKMLKKYRVPRANFSSLGNVLEN